RRRRGDAGGILAGVVWSLLHGPADTHRRAHDDTRNFLAASRSTPVMMFDRSEPLSLGVLWPAAGMMKGRSAMLGAVWYGASYPTVCVRAFATGGGVSRPRPARHSRKWACPRELRSQCWARLLRFIAGICSTGGRTSRIRTTTLRSAATSIVWKKD